MNAAPLTLIALKFLQLLVLKEVLLITACSLVKDEVKDVADRPRGGVKLF